MIEKIVFDYLKKELSAPVYMEYPNNPDKTMVLIEKTGSGMNDGHVFSAMIAVQSYAPTLFKTAELNETIKEKMLNIIDIDKICTCEVNSDYNYADIERNLHRYQAVFDITYLK